MNVKEMETFIQVCHDGSITKASRSLYISPQGISKTLKNMESYLGCALFLRSSKGIVPTKSGECLLKRAEAMLNEYRELKNDLSSIKQEQRGEIDMLSAYGILRTITPQCIQQFKKQNPNIEFTYREYPDRQVERLFLSGEGNLAFSIAPFPNGLYDVTILKTCRILMLVNKDHPLSEREFVTINDLRDESLYIESSEFKINEIIMKKCKESGFVPNIEFETSGFSLCHKMVKEKRGISVTVDFIYDDMKNEELVAIPFCEKELKWQMCLLTRRGEKTAEAVNTFKEYVISCINRK